MVTRIRNRSSGSVNNGGVATTSTYSINSASYISLQEDCTDVIGDYGGNHPLTLTRQRRHVTPMNGEYYSPTTGKLLWKYTNYVHVRTGGSPPGKLVPPTSDSALAPTVFARTNPSRPYVDTGQFIGELRDFPGMAQDIWKAVQSSVRFSKASDGLNQAVKDYFKSNRPDKAYLAGEFGWKPFVSDIMKYLDCQALVRRRIIELEALRNNGVTKSKAHLYNLHEVVSAGVVTCDTSVSTVKAFETKTRSVSQWGAARWYLQSTGRLANMRTLQQVEMLARETALGVTVDSSTLWNLMPWSWLVDWGSNLGDWISSQRNIIGASSGEACVMTLHTRLCNGQRTRGIDNLVGVTGGDYYALFEDKLRTVHSPSTLPELTLPIISGRQTAILGSLATTRIFR